MLPKIDHGCTCGLSKWTRRKKAIFANLVKPNTAKNSPPIKSPRIFFILMDSPAFRHGIINLVCAQNVCAKKWTTTDSKKKQQICEFIKI